jgi:hypothetical protein
MTDLKGKAAFCLRIVPSFSILLFSFKIRYNTDQSRFTVSQARKKEGEGNHETTPTEA